jgi:ribosomal protein S18 acetylase RimI-like enzyme
MTRLWEHEVLTGLRDALPPAPMMQRVLAGFDWEACSRVVESEQGMEGVVLVMRRASDDLTVARIEPAAAPDAAPASMPSLVEWGLGLARAAGAQVAQVWRAADTSGWLRDLGLKPVRPWLRMDRSLLSALPPVVPVGGYRLLDPETIRPGVWGDVFNHAFADHWRFMPRSDEQLRRGVPELSLLAADAAGDPAAITMCEIEEHAVDLRAQPVGVVGSVGTLPAHRRRGLARWLVSESLVRLRAAGAATASLYVDGENQHRAADLYTDLGFGVTFDTTIWEATFP